MIIKKDIKKILIVFFLSVCIFIQPDKIAAQQRRNVNTAPVSAAVLWEQRLNSTVSGSPFLQASSAVLVSDDGTVDSYFMSSTHLWNFSAQDRVTPFIARSYEGATYICTTAGLFMAINRVGRQLWQLNLDNPISFSPIVGWDGRLFIPVGSTIFCRTASGRSLWSLDLGSPIAVAPVMDHEGSIVMVLENNDFVRVNQFSTTERIRLNRIPSMIVALTDNRPGYVLFFPSGEMEKIEFNENAGRGNQLSRSSLRSLPAPPVAAASRKNQFVVTLQDGRTLSLDGSGNVLWTRNSHEHIEEKGSGNLTARQVLMSFDERGIYTISTKGITGYTAEGRRRFVFRLEVESSGVPAFSDEGLLYAAGRDNILRVYKVDAKPRTIPMTKYYGPEPEGTYGMGNPPPSQWANSPDRFSEANQRTMYAQIEAAIQSGQLGEREPEYVAYMMEMIGFFLNTPNYSPARPPVRPPERIQLIGLMGLIGSRETIPFLWNIFDRDREPSIKAACANAIGTIGVDPTGRSFVSYNFRVTPNNPNIDPYLVMAATTSIAKLCRFAGPPLAQDGIRVLRWFSNLPSISNQLKAQIRAEIDALYNEGLDILIQ